MLSNDLILVIGIVIGVLTIPAIFAAVTGGTAPRIATVSAVISGALVLYAIYNQPGGYAVEELPRIVGSVFGSLLR
ncbi:hypothetical protein [Litoreibacter roseus]|uniref:50S ribosomal protein L35 n=1 Tax=Litoreibacter roseus TaxID=2601869 RepID=A0A6N6JIL0_9RHOB|nr:hypothetical protein [Litoreibacter roseus]GFE65032.1 hypothetical protein KIN_21060 [Litoreibacter roseus]